MEALVLYAVLALVAVGLSLTSWLKVPLGLVVAAATLVTAAEAWPGALAAGLGVAAGRWMLATEARMQVQRGRPGPAARYGSRLSSWLSGHPAYQSMTFMLGLVPLVPANALWTIIGSVGAPRRYAALGTIVGQSLLIRLTTALWLLIADLISGGGREDATMLAAAGLLIAVLSIVSNLDWEHLRTTGRWRLDPARTDERRTELFISRMVDHPTEEAGPRNRAAGQIVEGEVVESEAEADDARARPEDTEGEDDPTRDPDGADPPQG